MCHRSGEYWQSIIWSGGQCHILCPKVFVDKYVKRDLPKFAELGIYGHHHIDAVGSFMTCYSKDHPVEKRAEYVGYIRQMFDLTIEHIGSVSTEMPFGTYFDLVDGFYHSYSNPSAWLKACSVGQYFLDQTVPLLTVVLHGCVNCCESVAKYQDRPLTWLDLGLTPQFEVCQRPTKDFGIPAYDSMADTMAEIYHQYFGEEGYRTRLSRKTIEGRWELGQGVSQTRYSDGTQVLVDMTNNTVQISNQLANV
jgi:hypothetical protein